MNTIHIILIVLLVFISSIMWIISLQQHDNMMYSMMTFYNPVGLSFSSSSSLIIGKEEKEEEKEEEKQIQGIKKKSSLSSWSPYSLKMILFVGSYLAVWALTGIAILIGWSIPMNYFFSMETSSTKQHL